MDLLQDSAGDLVIQDNSLQIVEGIVEIAQRVTQRLRTFYGEWRLDQTIGVRWLQEILKKNFNPTIRDSLLKSEITGTPGITGIEKYKFEVDNTTRAGTLNFQAKTIEGNLTTEVTVP